MSPKEKIFSINKNSPFTLGFVFLFFGLMIFVAFLGYREIGWYGPIVVIAIFVISTVIDSKKIGKG